MADVAADVPLDVGNLSSHVNAGLSQTDAVVRSAGIISAGTLLSRITGLAREMVMAYAFGAGAAHDAFLLGFRIPNLTRDLLGEGAFSSAFVPTFTRSLLYAGKRDAQDLAQQVLSALFTIVGPLCLMGMLFAPQLVHLLAPGFAVDLAKFALTVRLARIMFPFLLLIALASQVASMLNAQGSFAIPATASICFNAGAIVVGLLLGFVAGPLLHISPVEGMAYGVVAGGALQLLWQLPRLRRHGFRFVPLWKCSHPGLRHLGKLMLPALFATIAMQINLVVNTSFASRIVDPVRGADGPVSWLGYALRIVQFPMGVFGVALASAMLPAISRSVASLNYAEFRTTLSRSLAMLLFLTLPSSLVLIVLGRSLIGAIYQSGHFQLYDTSQTAHALTFYAVGLVAFAAARLLIPAYYALADSRTPMVLTLLSIVLNITLPLFLLGVLHMNFSALALTTSLAMAMEALCLFQGLRRKLNGLDGRFLFHRATHILAASLAMAAPLAVLDRRFWLHSEFTRHNFVIELSLLLPLAALLFSVAAKAFRVQEIDLAIKLFWRPLTLSCFPLSARIRG